MTFSAIDLPAAAPGTVDSAARSIGHVGRCQRPGGRRPRPADRAGRLSRELRRRPRGDHRGRLRRRLVERMGPSDLAAVDVDERPQRAPRRNSRPTRPSCSRRSKPSSRNRRSVPTASRRRPHRERGDGRSGGFSFVAGDQGALGDGHAQQRGERPRADSPSAQGGAAGQPGPAGLGRGHHHQPNAGGAAQALRDFILTAQRSNIAVYTMDPCGLDLDDGCSTILTPEPADARRGTGGFAVTNTNAPERSVDRMVAENGTYYLLGYASPAPPYDGKRHRIKVRTQESRPSRSGRATSYISPRKAPAANGGALASIDALIERADPIARSDACGRGGAGAAGARSPARRSRSASSCCRPMPPAPGASTSRLVAVDTNGKIRTRQRFQSSFQAKSGDGKRRIRLGSRVDVPPGRYQIRLAAVGGERRDRQRLHGSARAEIQRRPRARRPFARLAGAAHRQARRAARRRAAAGAAARPREFPAGDPGRRAASHSRQQPTATRTTHHRSEADARTVRHPTVARPAPARRRQAGFTAAGGAVYRCRYRPNLEAGLSAGRRGRARAGEGDSGGEVQSLPSA